VNLLLVLFSLALTKITALAKNFNQHDPQGTSQGLRGETPYKANPLNNCHVQNMTLTMEPRILSFEVSVREPPLFRAQSLSFILDQRLVRSGRRASTRASIQDLLQTRRRLQFPARLYS
jgi:hypothetical protein